MPFGSSVRPSGPHGPVSTLGSGRRPSSATTAASSAACSGVTSTSSSPIDRSASWRGVRAGVWIRPAPPSSAAGPESNPQRRYSSAIRLAPSVDAQVRERDVAALRERVVEPGERTAGEGAPELLAAVALDAGAGHAGDRGVRVEAIAVGRGSGEQLGDRRGLEALRERRGALRRARALVAHGGEQRTAAGVDEHDRAPPLAERRERAAAELEIDREAQGARRKLGRHALEHARHQRRYAFGGTERPGRQDARDQLAAAVEQQRPGAGVAGRERPLQPRAESAGGERNPARGDRHTRRRFVAGLEGERRRVERAERVPRAPEQVGERAGAVEAPCAKRRHHERLGGNESELVGRKRRHGAARRRRRQRLARARPVALAGPALRPGAQSTRRSGVARQQALPRALDVGPGLEPQLRDGQAQREERQRQDGGGPLEAPPLPARPRSAPDRQAFARAPASRAARAAWYCGSA